MTNIVDFPAAAAPELLCGPFEQWLVVVQGRFVPRLTGKRLESGNISLTVDGRFGASFTEEAAGQAAWLIAQASAVAAGYPHFEADSTSRPFAPIAMQITAGPANADLVPLNPEADQ